MLTSHLHLVPRTKSVEIYLHFSIRLVGVVIKHSDKFTCKIQVLTVVPLLQADAV